MANFDTLIQGTVGTDTNTYTQGKINSQVYAGVIDVGKLGADGVYASLDVIRLIPFETSAILEYFDAEITETLVGVTAVDAGNTISSSTDPDDYINNNTDTAVGRFTTYEAAAVVTVVLSADGFIAVRLTGTFNSSSSGKIAWRVKITAPAKLAVERAEKREYPNI